MTKIEFKKYSWTRWGERRGLLKEDLNEWSCTLCGNKHYEPTPSYFIPWSDLADEYMRVCPFCLNNAIRIGKTSFSDLLKLKVANLLTLPARY